MVIFIVKILIAHECKVEEFKKCDDPGYERPEK